MKRSYEEMLTDRILNTAPAALARKLSISNCTAKWMIEQVKDKQAAIVRNEITTLTTNDIAAKLEIPLELAAWLKEELTHV